jgi:hypothetical protein
MEVSGDKRCEVDVHIYLTINVHLLGIYPQIYNSILFCYIGVLNEDISWTAISRPTVRPTKVDILRQSPISIETFTISILCHLYIYNIHMC